MTARPSAGPRLVVIDDNPHVHWGDRHYPMDATFDQFLPALLEASPGVGSIVHCVPTRDTSTRPATLPTDARVRIVETAPFDGIGGYLAAAPRLVRANAKILGPVIAEADLVWIKVPASNAAIAGWLAARAGVARFGYVAGSALAVARARRLGLPAQAVGLSYDLVGGVAGGRHRIVVGDDIVTGAGVVTSLVESSEVGDRGVTTWPATPGRLRLAWAGRLAPGKGLDTLLEFACEPGRDRARIRIRAHRARRRDRAAGARGAGHAPRCGGQGHVARLRRGPRRIPRCARLGRRVRLPVRGGGIPQGDARCDGRRRRRCSRGSPRSPSGRSPTRA